VLPKSIGKFRRNFKVFRKKYPYRRNEVMKYRGTAW
jgi:hypothetical protein